MGTLKRTNDRLACKSINKMKEGYFSLAKAYFDSKYSQDFILTFKLLYQLSIGAFDFDFRWAPLIVPNGHPTRVSANKIEAPTKPDLLFREV